MTLGQMKISKRLSGIIVLLVHFFIPVFILIFCYGKIVCMLSRRISTKITEIHLENQNNSTTNGIKDDADLHKDKFQLARKNTIKTLLIVGCFFFICWCPNNVMYMMYNCGYDIDFNSTYLQSSILMVFFNVTVNPFIYLLQYRDYQIALKTFVCFTTRVRKGKQKQNSSSMSTVSNVQS